MKNKLKQIIKAKGLTIAELSKLTGIAFKKIEKLQAGVLKYDARFTVDILLPVCGKLGVTSDEIFDLPLGKFDKKNCDDTLLDSAIGFTIEACTRCKVTPNKKQIGKQATLVYDAAVILHLNVSQTRYIAELLVRGS